jgi:hypothetical protein
MFDGQQVSPSIVAVTLRKHCASSAIAYRAPSQPGHPSADVKSHGESTMQCITVLAIE